MQFPSLLYPLRYYYVMRWRREEEGVHFLATHDKQITFERLIPRHYSPSSTLLLSSNSSAVHSWARVIRSPIKGGILMKFSLFLAVPLPSRQSHFVKEVYIRFHSMELRRAVEQKHITRVLHPCWNYHPRTPFSNPLTDNFRHTFPLSSVSPPLHTCVPLILWRRCRLLHVNSLIRGEQSRYKTPSLFTPLSLRHRRRHRSHLERACS